MMRRRKQEARLAREADGTLDGSPRRGLAGHLDASPEHAAELGRQQHALELIASLNAEQAPPELHTAVQSLLADAPAPRTSRPRARRLVPAAAVALAAVALVAVLLAGAGSSAPTVKKAALLALRQPTEGSPQELPGRRVLRRTAAGISFPYWEDDLGWNTGGARSDNYAGRSATTVFYTSTLPSGASARVGYTILSGSALPLPHSPAVENSGTRYFVINDGGATVVTWRRDGHTCILAARGVPPGTLLHLAAWA
jgi:anti-sigma factor ChrR (cupin superfamily)